MGWAVKCTLDSREWQRMVDDDLRRNPPDTSANNGAVGELDPFPHWYIIAVRVGCGGRDKH